MTVSMNDSFQQKVRVINPISGATRRPAGQSDRQGLALHANHRAFQKPGVHDALHAMQANNNVRQTAHESLFRFLCFPRCRELAPFGWGAGP